MSRAHVVGERGCVGVDAKPTFDRKLMAYAAAAGAVVVGAQSAQAAIHTRVFNPPIDVIDTTIDLDVDDFGGPDFTFTNSVDLFSFSSVTGIGANQIVGHLVSISEGPTFVKASRLASSSNIDGDLDFYAGGTLATKGFGSDFGDWPGQSGFLGIVFDIGGSDAFGFIQMTVDSEPFGIHIEAVAWADPGEDFIHAQPLQAPPTGGVPEPVGLSALALGAVGLTRLRRRRSA